jgi:Xaa-Pro aminopeptidase
MVSEIRIKDERVRQFLAENGLGVIFLSQRSNVSWITGGRTNHVEMASKDGNGTLAITPNSKYLLANNIESARLIPEELADLGYQPETWGWQEGDAGFARVLRKIAAGSKCGTDSALPCDDAAWECVPMGAAFARMHFSLMPEEIERFKAAGSDTARCMDEAMRAIRPGMTEWEVAGLLAKPQLDLGLMPNLILVASDDRILKYRHPIPTNKRVEKVCMLVTCALRHGLVVNSTRIVHFGPLPEELNREHLAVCQIHAELMAATKPGATTAELWKVANDAYAAAGYAEEIKLHHQGGAAGYLGRDWFLMPGIDETVQPNQAYAWNPSITGTKGEETFIATETGPVLLTEQAGWPMLEVTAKGKTYRFADILEA